METTVTLNILGGPVTFTSRVEACRIGKVRPGPCPKGIKPDAPGVIPRKKTAAPKPRAKAPAQEPQDRKAREAEVDRLLKKPAHHGTPIGRVIAIFQDAAKRLGWKLDRPAMKATFTNRHGTGEVELIPQGYKTTVTLPGKQPHSRIWKNPADAFSHVSSQLHRSELP